MHKKKTYHNLNHSAIFAMWHFEFQNFLSHSVVYKFSKSNRRNESRYRFRSVLKENSVVQHYNLLPDKTYKNALLVFPVTKANKQIISLVIFFFIHIGASNFVLLFFFLA
jgi:hypothetical protein